MDTRWFAVDLDGNVALFWTSEDGAVPIGAAGEESVDLVGLCRALGTDPDELWERDAPAGMFGYRHRWPEPGQYARTQHIPERPVRLEALDPATRTALGKFQLPIRFAEAETVHLADHIDASRAMTWHDAPLRLPPGGFGASPRASRAPSPPRVDPRALLAALVVTACALLAAALLARG
jgi:hypothetical protein